MNIKKVNVESEVILEYIKKNNEDIIVLLGDLDRYRETLRGYVIKEGTPEEVQEAELAIQEAINDIGNSIVNEHRKLSSILNMYEDDREKNLENRLDRLEKKITDYIETKTGREDEEDKQIVVNTDIRDLGRDLINLKEIIERNVKSLVTSEAMNIRGSQMKEDARKDRKLISGEKAIAFNSNVDNDEIVRLYEEGLNVRQISDAIGNEIGGEAIRLRLKNLGVYKGIKK